MAKKALVTGANGFIGRYVARCLHQKGWHVDGMGHGAWSAEDSRKWGVSSWFEADVSLPVLSDYAVTPDLIIHCAGGGSVAASIADPYLDFNKTVNSTLSVLEFIRTKSPGTMIVYPSSAAVYGACEQGPIKEQQELKPLSPYGQHKRISETLIQEYSAGYGVKAAIVRLFSVYGPELKKQLLWDAYQRFMKGETLFFGSGYETRDWLHVEDAANLLSVAAEHADQVCPIVNGGTGVATTNKEILELINASMNLHEGPQFNDQIRLGDPQHYQADMQSIQNWDWKPHCHLTDGVKEYIDWASKEPS